LIVSGGGQLDEEWGGAWGHPFALFKWAMLARLAKVPLAFASVGACKAASTTSRFFSHAPCEVRITGRIETSTAGILPQLFLLRHRQMQLFQIWHSASRHPPKPHPRGCALLLEGERSLL